MIWWAWPDNSVRAYFRSAALARSVALDTILREMFPEAFKA
jgi:hypothetical protein